MDACVCVCVHIYSHIQLMRLWRLRKSHDMTSASQGNRKAWGVIHFESEGLRIGVMGSAVGEVV